MPSRRNGYATEAAAFRRVALLSRDLGIWPGVYRGADGRWYLTVNPPVTREHSPTPRLTDEVYCYDDEIGGFDWDTADIED